MKAILHLGTEKTGTSTVQKTFAQNRDALISQGFYFMRSTGNGNDRKLAVYCYDEDQYDDFHRSNGVNTYEKKIEFEKAFVKNFEEEISNIPSHVHTVIFSSEHFHSRLQRESQRKKLRALLCRFFGEFLLVSYLRPQVNMAVSHYSTMLKTKGTQSLSEYIKQCQPKKYYYDYWFFLTGWEKSFPGSDFCVRVFDKKVMAEGDVVSDFCGIIGLNVWKLEKARDANESVTPTGQELLRIINSKMPVKNQDGSINNKRLAIVRIVNKVYAGSGQKPGKDQATKIQAEFSNINEKVRQRWFPEKGNLFEVNFEEFDRQEPIQQEVVEFFSKVLESPGLLDAGKSLNNRPRDINTLRDTAVKLENHDVDAALNIMRVAQNLRPSGDFIRKKVVEYEKRKNKKEWVKSGSEKYYLSNEFRVKCYFDDPKKFVLDTSLQGLGCEFRKGKPFLFDLKNVDKYYSDFSSHYVDDMISFMETVNTKDPVPLVCGDSLLNEDVPAFIKSRKINGRGLLLKLNSKRHWSFDFNLDTAQWEDKKNGVIWRGVHTGRVGGSSQWKDKTLRLGFVQRYFEKYDIGFNAPGGQGVPECKPYVKGFVSQEEQLKKKYILSLEGNDVATNLKWVLASNSVPIMPKPTRETWLLESQLIPYVHYVPLSDDLDNLEDVYKWCLDNDGHCKKIAENGRRYMKMFFDENNEREIMRMIYERYCDLLRK